MCVVPAQGIGRAGIMLTARVEETDRSSAWNWRRRLRGRSRSAARGGSARSGPSYGEAIRRPGRKPAAESVLRRTLRLGHGAASAVGGDRQVELTPSEFEILKVMIRSPGRVFTRAQLLEARKGIAYEGYERTIDTHIKNLRQKSSPPTQSQYLLTVHGVGYKMSEN